MPGFLRWCGLIVFLLLVIASVCFAFAGIAASTNPNAELKVVLGDIGAAITFALLIPAFSRKFKE
jgi:hypothetical protein